MNVRSRSGSSVARVVAAALFCAAAGSLLVAKVKYYTLVEKARLADVILIGQITVLRSDSVVIRIQTPIKGVTPPEIELGWDRTGNVELAPAVHAVGDQILAFATGQANPYAPLGASQGTLKLQPGWADQYQFGIRQIIEFDSATTVDTKTAGLLQMMNAENRLSRASALEIIYLEYHTKAFATTPLVAPALRLARDPDPGVAIPAIQVLSRIGERDQIPGLIELMGAPDPNIAQTAFRVVKQMTKADLDFDPRQGRAARAAAATRWAQWWDANKDSVVLVK